MAVTNRWAVRDVATASFFDLATGKLKTKTDTLKMSNIENTAETVYSVGGSGAPKLVGFSGGRSARFVLQDALFTNEMLGMLLGNDVETKPSVVLENNILTVTGDKATMLYTPVTTGTLISVNKLLPDGTLGKAFEYQSATPTIDTYTVTDKEITFSTGSFIDGEKVLVYYETEGSTDSKHIKATTDKFAGSFRLVLDVLVRDFYLKKDFAAQITVPNVKIEDNWNLNLQPDGDPSVLDIPMEALRPADSNDLYTMVIYDEDDLE